MTASELLLILVGIVQYFLFAFAQEAMMLGASRQDKFVDPTANIFGIRELARAGILSRGGFATLYNIYADFFRGFFAFIKYIAIHSANIFRIGAAGFFKEDSVFAGDFELPDGNEQKTLSKLRYYIYLFNTLALGVLLIGIFFAVRQRGPETYIRPVDLFLIVAFNVFTIICLILAYEARVQILRGRYAIVINKLLDRRRMRAGDVNMDVIFNRLSDVISTIDADIKRNKPNPDHFDPQEEVLPKAVEEKIRRLAANPADAERFLVDNNLIFQEGRDK